MSFLVPVLISVLIPNPLPLSICHIFKPWPQPSSNSCLVLMASHKSILVFSSVQSVLKPSLVSISVLSSVRPLYLFPPLYRYQSCPLFDPCSHFCPWIGTRLILFIPCFCFNPCIDFLYILCSIIFSFLPFYQYSPCVLQCPDSIPCIGIHLDLFIPYPDSLSLVSEST